MCFLSEPKRLGHSLVSQCFILCLLTARWCEAVLVKNLSNFVWLWPVYASLGDLDQIHRDLFMPVWVALIRFQGHGDAAKAKLKIVLPRQVQTLYGC